MTRLIKICLLLIVFFPLVVDTSVFFPYVSGKNLYIQALSILVNLLFVSYFIYSKKFREEITSKVIKLVKNPLVISVSAFIFIFILNTFFAVDKFNAFWGDIVRAEGLVGMMFYFSIFVLTLLIFEKKDWLWFFRLTLIVTTVLLFKEFSQYFSGMARPDSYTGNPEYLAGYLLFSITSAIIVLFSIINPGLVAKPGFVPDSSSSACHSRAGGNPGLIFWRYFSFFIIIFSSIGILLTQTRGTILGLVFGLICALLYSAFKGKNIIYKKISLRKFVIIFFCLIFIFSSVFVTTRESGIWQKIPGLSRLAVIGTGNTEDVSTTIRLIVYQASLNAVNPVKNGWQKTLIGWGPDNYILAYGQYYNPELYKYQTDWSDRSHNKIIDIVVMNGLLGLLAYLTVLFLYFKFIFKKTADGVELDNDFSFVKLALLFWGVSYLTHLMFVFDQITTSIPFFIILAFVASNIISVSKRQNAETDNNLVKINKDNWSMIISGVFFVLVLIFLGYVFIRGTIPAYLQMKKYMSLTSSQDISQLNFGDDSIFTPKTNAQTYIRSGLLKLLSDSYISKPNEQTLSLLNDAIAKGEEYVDFRPTDFIFLNSLADTFSVDGNILKKIDYLKKGEEYYRRALSFAPNRQDINYGLAINLAYQKRFEESLSIIDRMIVLDPTVSDSYYKKGFILFLMGESTYKQSFTNFEKAFNMKIVINNRDSELDTNIYTQFVKYFYNLRDKESFVQVAKRLNNNGYAGASVLNQVIDYINTNKNWPIINFN